MSRKSDQKAFAAERLAEHKNSESLLSSSTNKNESQLTTTILPITDSATDSITNTTSAVSTESNEANCNSKTSAATHVVSEKNSSKQFANERWTFLKEAIVNKKSKFLNSKVSVRRFDSFGFLKSVKIAYNANITHLVSGDDRNTPRTSSLMYEDDDDDIYISKSGHGSTSSHVSNSKSNAKKSSTKESYQWYNISIPSIDPKETVKVRFYDDQVRLSSLTGFNNTGNVCLWPSEELMTVFCVKNYYIFDNKSVCELGGGMTCLSGLMISKLSQAKEVFLTDGNESSFENLEVICSENEFECSVECCLLQWNKNTNYGDLEERFDYIICADCLFFDEFREDLCMTIYKLLKIDGTCLIFAPNRHNTFHKFIDIAKLYFECMIVNDYDMEVWEKHLHEKETNPNYDEDIHYPLLLKLKKRATANNDFCKMVF